MPSLASLVCFLLPQSNIDRSLVQRMLSVCCHTPFDSERSFFQQCLCGSIPRFHSLPLPWSEQREEEEEERKKMAALSSSRNNDDAAIGSRRDTPQAEFTLLHQGAEAVSTLPPPP